MPARVPEGLGISPMRGEIPDVVGGDQPICRPSENQPPLKGDARLQGQGRDHGEQFGDPGLIDAQVGKVLELQRRPVAPKYPRQVGHRDTRNHARQVGLHTGEQGGGVAAEGEARDAHGGGSLIPDPTDHSPNIPNRLGFAVEGVQHFSAQEAIPRASPGAPGPVQGEHRDQHVQTEVVVVMAKGAQVDARQAHSVPVGADDPRAVARGMAQQVGMGRARRFEAQPTLSSGFVVMGGVATFEAQVLVGNAARSGGFDLWVESRGRVQVVAPGIVQPSPAAVEVHGLLDFVGHAPGRAAGGEPAGELLGAEHHLVQGHRGPEP